MKVIQAEEEKIRGYIEERGSLLIQLPEVSPQIKEYSLERLEQDLIDIAVISSNYSTNLEFAKKQGIEYNGESIDKAKKEARDNLTQQKEIYRFQGEKMKYQQTQQYLNEYKTKLFEFRSTITEVDEQLSI